MKLQSHQDSISLHLPCYPSILHHSPATLLPHHHPAISHPQPIRTPLHQLHPQLSLYYRQLRLHRATCSPLHHLSRCALNIQLGQCRHFKMGTYNLSNPVKKKKIFIVELGDGFQKKAEYYILIVILSLQNILV